MTRALALSAIAAIAACNAPSTNPRQPEPPPTAGSTIQLPDIGTGAMPMFLSGSFTLGATTAPGSASFTQAPRWLESEDVPPAGGGASFSVTVGGTAYEASAAQSFHALAFDDAGVEHLIAGAAEVDETARTARVLYVVVKRSDHAAGAELALDGVDRVALFAAGSIDAAAPEVYAAAISGSVRFGGGDLASGGPIDLTLEASFAELSVDEASDPARTPPAEPTEPPAVPQAGSYTLHVESSHEVLCAGAFEGKEAAFDGLGASYSGFQNVPVDLEVGSGDITLRGAGLVSGFGAEAVTLTPRTDELAAWFGETSLSDGAGPFDSRRAAASISLRVGVLTPTSINGYLGVAYVAASGDPADGFCELYYVVSLE